MLLSQEAERKEGTRLIAETLNTENTETERRRSQSDLKQLAVLSGGGVKESIAAMGFYNAF